MNAIQAPVEGSMVYNTTARRFFGYGGIGTSTAAISQTTSTGQQFASNGTLGQSFTVAAPGFYLSSADVLIAGNSGAAPLMMTVRSGADFTGTPLDTALATTGPFGAGGPLTFPFTGTPVFLAAGVYTLCVQLTSGASASWALGLAGNLYAGGTFFNTSGASVPGTDLYFIVRKSDAGWKPLEN